MAWRNVLLGFLVGAALGVAPALAMTPCGLTDLSSASWDVTAVSVNGEPYEWTGVTFTSDAGAVVHASLVRVWGEPTVELDTAAAVAPSCSVEAPRLTVQLNDPDTGESVETSVEHAP